MMKTALVLFLATTTLLLAEDKTTPIKVGQSIPDVTLRTEEDKEVRLQTLVAEKPTVLIFYRGGWCPYCTRHLQGLVEIEEDLRKAGFQLLAIGIDQPSKLAATPDRDKLPYRLLSDADAGASKAFGIAFKVEDELVAKYKNSYKIDLEAASGRTHHLLPHPSVFIVDTNGVIGFAHVNEDYKVRLEPQKVLEAAKATLK